jgi:LPXTG-motif cell wall-anchored protein
MEKSYNQRWKESGTTLTYKEWRRREDDKMASFDGIKAPNLNDSALYKKTINEMAKVGGYKETTSGKTTFGINNNVLLVGGLLIVGAIGFVVYKKIKKNG